MAESTSRRTVRAGMLGAALVLAAFSPSAAQSGADANAEADRITAAGRSFLVPGWGQHVLGQRRAWAYAVAEVALWAFWANRRSLAADARDAYRDVAWQEARSASAGRVDGDWTYYERLSKWVRSGAFDTDAQRPGTQPEEDPSTFNGSIWRRARDLHFGGSQPSEADPAYTRAVEYYERQAYGDAFLWDWSGREQALLRYRDLIDESDDRFRQATATLGAVLANHLLAGTDAYLSARIPGEPRLRVTPETRAGMPGWGFTLRLKVP